MKQQNSGNMKNLAVSITMGLGLSMVLTACGGLNQDPLEKYPLTSASKPIDDPNDLKRVMPEIQKVVVVEEKPVDRPVYVLKELEQNYAAAQLFSITTRSLNFVAGQESKIPVEVRLLQGEANFSAAVVGLDGAVMNEVSAEGNKKTYELTYTPPIDAIPGSSREKSESLQIVFQASAIKAENADKQKRLQQAFDAISKAKAFDYTIRRDFNMPKLEIAGFPASINEGSKQSFKIKVTAPGTYKGYEPSISMDFEGALNGALYENNGIAFIRTTPIVMTGKNEWVQEFELNTNLFPVPVQLDKNLNRVDSATSSLFRLSFQVISATGSTSDKRVVQFKIVKTPAPAAQTSELTLPTQPVEKQ